MPLGPLLPQGAHGRHPGDFTKPPVLEQGCQPSTRGVTRKLTHVYKLKTEKQLLLFSCVANY